MGIERNYPVEFTTIKGKQMVERSILERLFAALSKECQDWKRSDGEIWWDSPENWLRKQLHLPKIKR